MDRLEAMSVLVAAVETGSLTAAGKRLNMPLPTVSRKLGELEEHLGTRLVARTTRSLSLTDAGADYYAACIRILGEVGEAERKASGEQSEPKGELVITAPIVFGRLHMLPVVTAFLDLYPEIDIRLLLSDRNAQLMEDQIDLALRIGSLPDSSMVATRVGEVRHVVCASPAFIAQTGMPQTPPDLARLPCVTFDMAAARSPWIFRNGQGGNGQMVEVNARLCVNTAEAAIDAAAAGTGLTRVLSYQVADAVADRRLQIVLEDFEPPGLPVTLLHQGQGALPMKLRRFMDFAIPELRNRLSNGATPASEKA